MLDQQEPSNQFHNPYLDSFKQAPSNFYSKLEIEDKSYNNEYSNVPGNYNQKYTHQNTPLLDLSQNPFFLQRLKDRSLNLPFKEDISLYMLDQMKRKSVLLNRKPISRYEETTLIEMFENRVRGPEGKTFGFLLLAIVIVSGAAFVPFGVALDVSNPMTKVSWRVTNLIPFLLVAGIVQTKNTSGFDWRTVFQKDMLINMTCSAFAIAMQQCAAITSGKYTLMSHSVIFVNLSAPVLVFWRLTRREFVHKLEMLGCAISIFGSVVSMLDANAEKANPEESNILFGDMIALIGSFLGAIWMTKNEQIVQKVPPLLAMLIIMVLCNIILMIVGCILFKDFTFDMDPHTGVFGFLTPELWLYVVIFYGFFTGACNLGSFAMCCKFFSPIVLGTAVLLEPIGSQIIGCIMGLDKVPGALTFLGTIGTLVGLYFVAKGGQLKSKLTLDL